MKPPRFRMGLAVPVQFTVRSSRHRCGMRRWLLLVALNFAAWIVLFCLGFGDGRFRPGPELYLVRSIAISLGLPLVPVLPILGPDRLPDEVLLVVCLILNPPLWATLVHLLLWRFVDPPQDPTP